MYIHINGHPNKYVAKAGKPQYKSISEKIHMAYLHCISHNGVWKVFLEY